MIDTGTTIEAFRRMKIVVICIGVLFANYASAAGLVDPTRPSSLQSDAEPVYAGPVLQSTIIAPGSRRAVISGRSYTVGERVGTSLITHIAPYEVTLNKDGRETRLRIVPSLAKDARPADGQDKGVKP